MPAQRIETELAYEWHRQSQIDTLLNALAHPDDGKSKLSPEAYALLAIAKL